MSARTRLFVPTLLLCVAFAASSCASADPDAPEHVEQAHAAISGGQPDATDANVFVLVSHRGSEGAALCSASLIAPNLLLTARHCVSDVTAEVVVCGQAEASAPFAAGTFYAANVQSIDKVSNAQVFQGATVSVPSQGSDLCGFDIALVTLASSVPSSMAVPLVPRIDSPVARGEIYSAVGYGQDSPGDAGEAGARMDRSGLKVNCAPGNCGSGVEATEFVGDTGICSGDSGGPALDSAHKVVGVVSRSGEDCAHPVYGSVASWKDWIIEVAKQAAVQGNYDPPFWVVTGTSDPPAATASNDAGGVGAAGASAAAVSSGTQGATCGGPQDCETGYGCFSPDGTKASAYCAERCDAQTKCASGTHCQTGIGVCIDNVPSVASSGSCALRPGSLPRMPERLALLACFALGLAAWRRGRARTRFRVAG